MDLMRRKFDGLAENDSCDLREHCTGSVVAWTRLLVRVTQNQTMHYLRLYEPVR